MRIKGLQAPFSSSLMLVYDCRVSKISVGAAAAAAKKREVMLKTFMAVERRNYFAELNELAVAKAETGEDSFQYLCDGLSS